jgi:predicted  nucleic acid-binding Zn-ribbon protein
MATATTTAMQAREALAHRVASAFAKLADHREDIEQLWREFEKLEEDGVIMGCATKTEFCEKVLGRSIRTVQYMMLGGNHNRGETVSPAEIAEDLELSTEAEIAQREQAETTEEPAESVRDRSQSTAEYIQKFTTRLEQVRTKLEFIRKEWKALLKQQPKEMAALQNEMKKLKADL